MTNFQVTSHACYVIASMHIDMNDYENLTNPISSMVGGTMLSGSVSIIDDIINEDTESFSLHIHNCTNNVTGCSVLMPYSLITINDNDGK